MPMLIWVLLVFPSYEVGYASVYADKYNGKRTASGEIYDRNEQVAAHPYLPFGTLVKVKNLRNGKWVEVRIIDRFLPTKGRFINLSRRSARLIGWRPSDRVKVSIRRLPRGVRTFVQRGVASWYGGKFHGRKSACGIRFDTYKMYAAHKTLPCGAVVRVVNLDNGRSVKVRIVDRGPYRRGRIIDLSYAAARRLGMVRRGTARVRIEVVKWPPVVRWR